jgi:hypothetical protein
MTKIKTLIPVDRNRSALFDLPNLVLLFTLERILRCINYPLANLHEVAMLDLPFRKDPVNGKLCLALNEIPRLLKIIDSPKYANSLLVRRLAREISTLENRLKNTDLIGNPWQLNEDLKSIIQPAKRCLSF